MKLAIISKSSSPNTQDLLRVCGERAIGCTVYQAATITIDTKSIENDPFYSHDVYLFRGYNSTYHQAQSLAQYLMSLGKIVIDEQLAKGFVPSKLHEAMVYTSQNIPHPRTYYFRDGSDERISGIELPVVVKDVDSQRGKGVRLCATLDDLRQEIDQNGKSVIVQQFIQLSYDLRVICVGDTVVGAIRRSVVDGDFRTNVSLGAKAEPYALSRDEAALALRAHVAMAYDISGVDIAYDTNGQPFILETNITPEWQGFKSATGIDVAAIVIDYAERRYNDESK
ncbi:MAG: RimK family alpha-L-glutamate ligase [Patescibacteria group bacterium]